MSRYNSWQSNRALETSQDCNKVWNGHEENLQERATHTTECTGELRLRQFSVLKPEGGEQQLLGCGLKTIINRFQVEVEVK